MTSSTGFTHIFTGGADGVRYCRGGARREPVMHVFDIHNVISMDLNPGLGFCARCIMNVASKPRGWHNRIWCEFPTKLHDDDIGEGTPATIVRWRSVYDPARQRRYAPGTVVSCERDHVGWLRKMYVRDETVPNVTLAFVRPDPFDYVGVSLLEWGTTKDKIQLEWIGPQHLDYGDTLLIVGERRHA